MEHEAMVKLAPKLLVIITDRAKTPQLEDILREKHVHFHYMFNAMGTARSDILKAFGLSGTEKVVCLCVEATARATPLLVSVADRLVLSHPGNGIVFLVPVSGISAAVTHIFNEELQQQKERLAQLMETQADKTTQEASYELVIAMVNQGFSDHVMDEAHAVGARGGTVINARHCGLEEAVKFFGVTLQAEKEIVAILVRRSQKKELMQRVSKACGINTPAHGVVLSVPVESCAGIGEGLAEE